MAGPRSLASAPVWPCSTSGRQCQRRAREVVAELTGTEQRRTQAVARVAQLAGQPDETLQHALEELWAAGYEAGRLAALDELQDRFCVCMK